MPERSVFEQIKKQNGEAFAKAIRAYDNGIFDVPNIVNIVQYAGRESEPIIPYLESLKKIKIETQSAIKDPIALLADAGYEAWYADTVEKQNAISKYYASGEELCTFRDPNRYKNYYIINAVRRDADQLNRDDFRGREEREDTYGTSVLSIQILKSGGFISIKNRYNHKVPNPDNTFGSNPDNIIRGLSDSLSQYFHVDFSSVKGCVPDPFIVFKKQLLRYHLEVEGVYIGDGFYLKNGILNTIDRDKEILMGTFILNLKEKTIRNIGPRYDCFPWYLEKEIHGKTVQVTKDGDKRHVFVIDPQNRTPKNKIATIRGGRLIALTLPTTKCIAGDFFLSNDQYLEEFNAPDLEEIKDHFLVYNKRLQILNLPVLKKVGNCFLQSNQGLRNVCLPALQRAGTFFLKENENLVMFNAPMLEEVGEQFLSESRVQRLNLPFLKKVGSGFMVGNGFISDVRLPSLTSVGHYFLAHARRLQRLRLPSLEKADNYFLMEGVSLEELDLPHLERVGIGFLSSNEKLRTANLPALQEVGDQFMPRNWRLTQLKVSVLKKTKEGMSPNKKIGVKNIKKQAFLIRILSLWQQKWYQR